MNAWCMVSRKRRSAVLGQELRRECEARPLGLDLVQAMAIAGEDVEPATTVAAKPRIDQELAAAKRFAMSRAASAHRDVRPLSISWRCRKMPCAVGTRTSSWPNRISVGARTAGEMAASK